MQFLRLATNSLILFVQTRAVKNLVLLLDLLCYKVKTSNKRGNRNKTTKAKSKVPD